MTLTLCFSHSTGVWTLENGVVVVPPGHSWAGNDSNPDWNPQHTHGKLNHLMQDVPNIGPLPIKLYRVGEWAFTKQDSTRLGYPAHLGLGITKLTPVDTSNMFGRDGFFIHGPASDPAKRGQESRGCPVVEHDYRINQIAARKPDFVNVTA